MKIKTNLLTIVALAALSLSAMAQTTTNDIRAKTAAMIARNRQAVADASSAAMSSSSARVAEPAESPSPMGFDSSTPDCGISLTLLSRGPCMSCPTNIVPMSAIGSRCSLTGGHHTPMWDSDKGCYTMAIHIGD